MVSLICGNVNTKKRRRREERWRDKKERKLAEEGLLRNGKGVGVVEKIEGQVGMADAGVLLGSITDRLNSSSQGLRTPPRCFYGTSSSIALLRNHRGHHFPLEPKLHFLNF